MTKYLLIDGDSLAYMSMNSDTFEDATSYIDNLIYDMLLANKCNKYHIFLSRSSFRKEISTIRTYKGNRKRVDNVFLPSLLKYIEVEHKGVSLNKLEADDLVCYFKNKDPENSIICSIDKDVLKQIPGNHYNYRTKEIVKTTPWGSIFFLWKQVLMGDSTDNIVGIPKIGDKKSTKILSGITKERELYEEVLKEYINYYGQIKGINFFNETLNLVYLLKTDEDMMSRIDDLPELSEGRDVEIHKEIIDLI